MISIIIPLYNKADSIINTLQCIEKQSYRDYEIIIVDDGSTDDGHKKVLSSGVGNIKLIRQQNAGVSAARNRGIKEAAGEFVAFLDADDEWHEDYLSIQAGMIERFPESDVFAVNYTFKRSDGSTFPTIINRLKFESECGIMNNYFEIAAHSHPPLWTSAVVARKKAIESIGGFPVGVTSGEDLITWAKLACNGTIAYCTLPLAIYNLGEGYNYSNLPPRRQDSDDYVGKQLKAMLTARPQEPGLRDYVSLWHKMRASVALRYGETQETLRECGKSLRYNPLNYKILPFIILSLIPRSLRNRIIALKK